MPTLAATRTLASAAYFATLSSLLTSATALLSRGSRLYRILLLHFKRDLVDLPGESSFRTNADALGDRCLIVHADVRSLVGREHVGLSLLHTSFSDLLAVRVERRLAALAGSAAVVDEVESDCDWTRRECLRRGDGVARQPEEVVGVRGLPILHVQR